MTHIWSIAFACLSCQFVALLFLTTPATARPSSIWDISIDESPAPLPKDGPPLSASAIRDKAYLPLELGAVFGAYFFAVIVVASSVLTIGRRLRRSAQTSPRSLAMEMMKPMNTVIAQPTLDTEISPTRSNPFGPSPVSPSGTTSVFWPTPVLNQSAFVSTQPSTNKKKTSIQSLQSSVVTLDPTVVEEDRAKNEMEMDRLYAAVAQQDTRKSRALTNPPLSPLAQHPPELQHLRGLRTPPKSPPAWAEPTSPSRQTTVSPLRTNTTSPPRSGARSGRPIPISITGFTSPKAHSRASSQTSLGNFSGRSSVRNMSISHPMSPPMGSPELHEDNMRQYDDAEPLTPRTYNPGPPPLPPVGGQASARNETPSQILSPTRNMFSKHFSSSIRSSRASSFASPPRTPRTPRNQPTFTLTQDPIEEPAFEVPVPRQLAPAPAPRSKKPAPLPLHITAHPSDGASSMALRNGSLPLRTAPLPLRSLATPTSGMRPPSTIKATVLERKIDDKRLRAPGTGVPSTPYSPFYFPQTPLTPMTPSRLVTREERKRAKKEEGRRVATEQDAVITEEDMWGDSY